MNEDDKKANGEVIEHQREAKEDEKKKKKRLKNRKIKQ